jgi:hypothetical protein
MFLFEANVIHKIQTAIIIFFMAFRGVRWCLMGCFLWLLLPQTTKAQVRIDIPKDTFCLVGDTITLPVKISCNAATNIQQFDFQDWATLQKVRVITPNPTLAPDSITPTEGGAHYLASLKIQLLDTGLNTLPPLRVLTNSGGTNLFAASDSLRIEVFSPQLADIKDIIAEPYDFWQDTAPTLTVVLIIILILLIAFLIYQKRKNRPLPQPLQTETRLTPHELALQRLAQLEAQQLWQRGEFDGFYTEATFIVREYIENRFGVPALENTTDELMQALENRHFLTPEHRKELKSLLTLADLVKFAAYEPIHVNHENTLQTVLNIIESSKPRIEMTTPT